MKLMYNGKGMTVFLMALLLGWLNFGCGKSAAHRVVIIGIDGMDYKLTKQWMDAGLLPNLAELAREGGFSPMGTSIPPESPVAWSNFITGRNPGGHGVFDFLVPGWSEDGSFQPADAVAAGNPVTSSIELFGFEFPLAGGDTFNKRQGAAFWEVLEAHDIPAVVFKMPAHFPPTPTGQKTLSGMGTPDHQGGYGVYYVYTDDDAFVFSDKIESGKVISVSIINHHFKDFIYGPKNIAKAGKDKPITTAPLTVYIDPVDPIAKIVVGDEDSDPEEIVLKEGEWSDFVPMDFEIVPMLASVSGITRFYLKQVRPNFMLFVDPININPASPMPDISTPSDWASELFERYGYFYTKGMPEDTKALEEGALSYEEFRQQSLLIYEKRKEMLFDMLEEHKSGLLFYYICSIDLDSHMFWRCMDKQHPGHDPLEANENFIQWLYSDMDRVIGQIRKRLDPEDTLIVMSDHGFAPYYRSFNLNSWLLEHGYITLKEETERDAVISFLGVDWTKTKAYNLGFAGLYINRKYREPHGIVEPGDVEDLVNELCGRLMDVTDPVNGEKVFLTMYKTREAYSGTSVDLAPDIVVGCRARYRISDESALGAFPEEIIHDNLEKWSGCHLMAAEEVPGVLITNRKIRLRDPKLYDLTVAVLAEYGIEKLPDMIGRPIFD